MEVNKWIFQIIGSKIKKAMPLLSFPGTNIIGVKVGEMVKDGLLQAKCMQAIAAMYDMPASVSPMDLSVEAEAFGSKVIFSENEPPTVAGRIIEDSNCVKKLNIPKIGEARTGEYIKAVQRAKNIITDRPVFAGAIGPFSLAGRLFDMTEIMILSMDEPDLVHEVLKKAAEFIASYAQAFKKSGADGIILAEPAAGLLSPAMNREFSVPYIKQIINGVKSEDFTVIYHNCGNTIPLIDDIIKTGAHGFHFGNYIKLEEILPLIPNTAAVFGNVSPAGQFMRGTKKSITENTIEILEKCGKYKNYIPSSGCDIPPDSPFENIDAFFAAVQKWQIQRDAP